MATPPSPRAVRMLLGVAGAFMVIVATLGVAAHIAGHTPPSHPYAEITLVLLGTSTLLMNHRAAGGGRIATGARLTAGLLGAVSAALWCASAFTRFGE